MAKSEKINQEKGKNGGVREGAGRPAFVPTDKDRGLVEQLATWGVAEHHIAPLIADGISMPTLRQYFADEIMKGRAKASMGIGSTLYQKAMAGDVASLIWWTKTQMRWAEQPKVIEISGQISITQALEEAAQRVIEAEIVEVDEPLQLGVSQADSGIGCGNAPDLVLEPRASAQGSADDASAIAKE